MRKFLFIVVMITGMSLMGLNVFAENGQPKEKDRSDLSREKKLFRNYSGEGSNSVISFCMEDQVFVMVSGNLSNFPSIVQVYEEKSGKVVPKKCN